MPPHSRASLDLVDHVVHTEYRVDRIKSEASPIRKARDRIAVQLERARSAFCSDWVIFAKQQTKVTVNTLAMRSGNATHFCARLPALGEYLEWKLT
jgi:phosphoribosylaminoimidazole carboxylase (NCAIR synthetase)